MASIQRIKSPLTGEISYKAQVRVKGRPCQTKTFPNKKEAERWSASLETAIRENRHHPHLAAGKTSFAEAVKRYLETVVNESNDLATRKMHLEWFGDHLAGATLAEVTAARIASARDALAVEKFTRGKVKRDKKTGEIKSTPKEYARSGATCNRYLATLSHMLSIATKEWRLIDRNPVADITRKKESRGRTRFLTEGERQKLLEACAQSEWSQLRTLVILAITTGARRGELVTLRWDAVDLKAGRALVTETKNDEPRTLPLVGTALEALREMKLNGGGKSEFVFPNPSGFPGPFEQFDHRWYAAVKAAGLEGFRFHDLRHTTASYLAANGASLLEIADVLGHKTLAMVKRYSHLTQSHKATVVEKMVKAQGL